MSKKTFLILALISTIASVNAEIQSPIYTDDIGRSHFLGRGGYSSVRSMQMNEAQAGFVNDAVNKYSNEKTQIKEQAKATKDDLQQVEADITKVIKEKSEVPVSRQKAVFSSEKRQLDPSAPYGYGSTYLPAGVNDSKTLYTDELGRLHFFGKGNKIIESSTQK